VAQIITVVVEEEQVGKVVPEFLKMVMEVLDNHFLHLHIHFVFLLHIFQDLLHQEIHYPHIIHHHQQVIMEVVEVEVATHQQHRKVAVESVVAVRVVILVDLSQQVLLLPEQAKVLIILEEAVVEQQLVVGHLKISGDNQVVKELSLSVT
jgi:hypothetical protein